MRRAGRLPSLALVGLVALVAVVASGCGGMLDPQGPRAARVATMWWVMLWTSVAVMVLVLAVLFVALVRARRPDAPEYVDTLTRDRWLVFGGGIGLPVLVGVVLMVLTVWTGRAVTEAAPEDNVRVEVIGHQWWWEIRYPDADVVTANELHVPAGEAVEVLLKSEDVIHSFWVPELAGKIDLVPGQTNSVILEASEPGMFRGQCAEFCGLQHAGMRFRVYAEPREDFDEWLAAQAEPADPVGPEDEALLAGQQAFLNSACVYCHTIRGTNASGTVGPDLTHIASRETLASGVIPNTRGYLAGWILDPQAVKPGTQMPPTQLSAEELDAILGYLQALD